MKNIVTMAPRATEAQMALARSIAAAGLPPDAQIIYEGRNRVARVVCDGKPLIVKEFKVPNIINRYVYVTLRKSKARRSFENALRLLQMDFGTPAPIAWMECRNTLSLGLSYYICEEVRGKDLRSLTAKPEAEPLIHALAREMGRLHSAGVWHKDFSPGNILYTSETREGKMLFKFYLIDLNRMQFGVKHPGKLLSNFGMLGNELEVRRIARAYAPFSPFSLTEAQADRQARDARRRFLSHHPQARTPADS